MKIKYEVEFVDTGEEFICVPLGDKENHVSGVLKMNQGAKEIVELLKDDTSETCMLDYLESKYDNDTQVLKQYIQSVVETLRKNGLLDE